MLPIFPEGALTSSVITTVWVGVFVLAFFNLRFGWVMSGLVVPGYVVPLLVLRPFAAGVIVVEAVLTYLIAYFFSERFSRGRYNALFGRDRFMALILASIAVRLTFDGWLLPQAAEWLSRRYDWQFDWHSNLQSFGLVVISLMANQFWKPGLARGLIAAAVTIGLTWLIVRYGLMEFTNFRLSGVTYVYEGLASSILASPKAYIILVLTAFIASQMNVRYGWDFSGILIPALIALQWYQPTKVLSSIVEAGVIYLLAIAVMKLPFCQHDDRGFAQAGAVFQRQFCLQTGAWPRTRVARTRCQDNGFLRVWLSAFHASGDQGLRQEHLPASHAQYA